MMVKKRARLVVQHMEGISAKMFDQYKAAIREQIGRQHGIYALYKRDRLYYVGLAKNLRGRLSTHLRDRHHGLWDKFSDYLTNEAHHIKELESLVLRIVKPKGNKQVGKCPGSIDVKKVLARDVRLRQREELRVLVGGRSKVIKKPQRRNDRSDGVVASLQPFIDRQIKLQATYKGKVYHASVRPDGWIRFNGYLYASPSDIAKEIIGRPVSGWHFWKWERSPGKWARLKTLKG